MRGTGAAGSWEVAFAPRLEADQPGSLEGRGRIESEPCRLGNCEVVVGLA